MHATHESILARSFLLLAPLSTHRAFQTAPRPGKHAGGLGRSPGLQVTARHQRRLRRPAGRGCGRASGQTACCDGCAEGWPEQGASRRPQLELALAAERLGGPTAAPSRLADSPPLPASSRPAGRGGGVSRGGLQARPRTKFGCERLTWCLGLQCDRKHVGRSPGIAWSQPEKGWRRQRRGARWRRVAGGGSGMTSCLAAQSRGSLQR